MLAHILAVLVGTGSVGLYLAAFFLPDIHRKQDFIWSGVGLFYALTLWIYARQEIGGLLVGQIASVALLGWLGWQTFILRRQLIPVSQQSPIPSTTKPSVQRGLDRSIATASQPIAKTAPLATATPPVTTAAPNPIAQVPPTPKTAPVAQNIPQSSSPSPSTRSTSQQAAPSQTVSPSPVSAPSVPVPPSPNAPVESKLPVAPLTATPPSSPKNDVSEPIPRVDATAAVEKAWIELKVRSAPAPKPLGTAAKPPTPTSPSISNPQPQPLLPSTTEDRSTIAPIDPIAADVADRE